MDVVRLRDFGDLGTDQSDQAMAVSPDGRQLVVQLRQGMPDTNDYCTALVVVATDGTGSPSVISDTGDIVPAHVDMYGIAGIQMGAPLIAPVVWAPDSQWIAFVKTRAEGAEIWRTRPDGSDTTRVYASPVPIDSLAWTGDGSGLVFASAPGAMDAQQAIDREGRSGFHYDGRFWPLASMVPYPQAGSIPTVIQVADPRSGTVRVATATERAALDPSVASTAPKDAVLTARAARGGAEAWTLSDHPGWMGARPRLHVRIAGAEVPCAADACRDITGLWWMADGRTLLFLGRDGVARSRARLFRWRPGESGPRLLFATNDAIFGCHADGDRLICAYESSLHPRRVVSIDRKDGVVRTLFDPNPEWASMRLGAVERLVWRNSFGLETFGDLVLPTDYRPGRRVPLIVVQYESRGFLRGGTADDYPIQLYAAHGFAVLSFNRPPYPSLRKGPQPLDAFARDNQKDWIDRRSVLSSLETVIGQLAARGIIDPARVGITGQSDGAATATFALIHSKLFAAAALSTCCEDPDMMATLGSGFADTYADRGYPRAGLERADFWTENALDLHADRSPVPILIQASEQEAHMALRTYTILKNAHWPLDMYVFPGEAHVKLQSAHRLALFERSLAWFETWLGPAKPPTAGADEGHPGQSAAHASISTH